MVCVDRVVLLAACVGIGAGFADVLRGEEVGPQKRAVLEVTAAGTGANLVANSSFEAVGEKGVASWAFDKRNTDATMVVDESVSHSGKRSIKFTNGTAFGAHVYGIVVLEGMIPVKPSTAYTVSAYVKSEGPGVAWVGGGRGWRCRCRLPETGGKWERVWETFTTEADETSIPFMIVTESPTKGFWVDDVKLEEGSEPTAYAGGGAERRAVIEIRPARRAPVKRFGAVFWPYWAASRYPIESSFFATDTFSADGVVYVPEGMAGAGVRVRLSRPDNTVIAEAATKQGVSKGTCRVRFQAYVGDVGNGPVKLTAELADGDRVAAQTAQEIQLYTQRDALAKIGKVEESTQRFRGMVDRLAAKGMDAYARATLTVLENFLPWAREDVQHGFVDRAWDAAVVMEGMASRATARAEEVLGGKRKGMMVPRYITGRGRMAIDGPSFVANTLIPFGLAEPKRGPVFFVGYGHFGQVKADIEKLPAYGCNIMQIEFGPSSVLPAEDKISDGAIDEFLSICDRAAKAGVSVNLLLSPHYFPQWAMKKWPHLSECSGGFFRYCVHAPESRAVLEKSLRHVIPRIKDHPAVHSLCLSNEPVSMEVSKCRYVRKAWQEWLGRKHGDIARLNEHWRTTYKDFAEIPVPDDLAASPLVYDFVCFNQEEFAGFHRWMADVIHEMAPAMPVHAKIMMGNHFPRNKGGIWSVCPELFGDLSQIHGNDAYRWFSRGGLRWSQGSGEATWADDVLRAVRGDEAWSSQWIGETAAYDFQRSMGDKPVFNSENHLIMDRDQDVVIPEYIHNVLWQGAIHGQSATTIWVWERTYSHTDDTTGSILHRPDCAEATGHACLDLNRLAAEVTAIQKIRPEVVMLWSQASVVQGDAPVRELQAVYPAINSLGVGLGFVTERQLTRYARGEEIPLPLRSAKAVVAVGVTHIPDAALDGLRKFEKTGGKVVRIGDCFGSDEYMRPRAGGAAIGEVLERPAGERELLAAVDGRLHGWGIDRYVRVVDGADRPVWGVEARTARTGDRWIVNLSNHLRVAQKVRLLVEGRPAKGVDLICGEPVGEEFVVEPLRVRLVQIGEDAG